MPFISRPKATLPSAVRQGNKLREILEHHAAVLPWPVTGLAGDANLAAGGRQEAGDDVEQR